MEWVKIIASELFSIFYGDQPITSYKNKKGQKIEYVEWVVVAYCSPKDSTETFCAIFRETSKIIQKILQNNMHYRRYLEHIIEKCGQLLSLMQWGCVKIIVFIKGNHFLAHHCHMKSRKMWKITVNKYNTDDVENSFSWTMNQSEYTVWGNSLQCLRWMMILRCDV